MTTTPGYLVTITAFVRADPNELPSMAAAMETIFGNIQALERNGMKEVAFDYRFVARHKSPSPPAPAPIPEGEPTQPLDNAPAGTVAGGASDISGPSGEAGTDARPAPADVRPPEAQAAGKADGQPAADISFGDLARAINGGPCRHPRTKRYAGGQRVCLDCQATRGSRRSGRGWTIRTPIPSISPIGRPLRCATCLPSWRTADERP